MNQLKSTNSPVILIADDDRDILSIIETILQEDGYQTLTASDGEQAVMLVQTHAVQLLILDIMMPGIDGYEVCKQIRSQYNTLIVFISALSEDENQLKAYEYGADDYITKPFKPSLLYAKCLALLKRNKKIETNQLQSGKVILDLDKHILVIEENDIVLTDKEFKLLRYLMKNQGIVLSREKILDTLWGYDYYGDGRAVDTYIKRLRKRLGKYSYYIQTIVKTGYMWKGEES